MSDRQRVVDQLILHENIRLKVYFDPKGIATLGVGRNVSGKGISHGEAMMLLDHDIDECVTDLSGSFPWFCDLDPVRQRAIVDMRFNLGGAGFRGFKRMIRMMAERNYPQASASAQQSLWFTQVRSRGPRIADMIRTGLDYER